MCDFCFVFCSAKLFGVSRGRKGRMEGEVPISFLWNNGTCDYAIEGVTWYSALQVQRINKSPPSSQHWQLPPSAFQSSSHSLRVSKKRIKTMADPLLPKEVLEVKGVPPVGVPASERQKWCRSDTNDRGKKRSTPKPTQKFCCFQYLLPEMRWWVQH